MSHVFLTGFMGAGKTTVGRLLAAELGYPFVDLDAEIECREGATIADLFRSHGESGFREAEHSALEALSGEPASVIATGGGVVLREDNQALMSESGTVVYLSVTPEEAMARLGGAGDRPLLADGGLAAARTILSARLALYAATADHAVDTGGLSAAEVAAAIREALGHPAEGADPVSIVRVGASAAAYEVVIGPGMLSSIGSRVRSITGAAPVALVTDDNVWPLFGASVRDSLVAAGLTVGETVIPAGEASKSWETAGGLLERFAAQGLDRGSAVVALGGGVVGDLAGLCAATYMRGIALVHLPTTLLAQVDSAIGGKTAVDLAAGKNLAGAFWPPRLVLADTKTLATLPEAEWTNGMAEVVKTALLAGDEPLGRLESTLDAVMSREPAAVHAAVHDAAAFKASVVSADLREADVRECLNLGHTLGHALEMLVGYGVLPHGLAIAEGMRFASRLAEDLVDADPALTRRTAALLERIGAGAKITRALVETRVGSVTAEALLSAMRSDKKSRGGVVRFVLLETPGVWHARAVSDDVLSRAVETWLSQAGEA